MGWARECLAAASDGMDRLRLPFSFLAMSTPRPFTPDPNRYHPAPCAPTRSHLAPRGTTVSCLVSSGLSPTPSLPYPHPAHRVLNPRPPTPRFFRPEDSLYGIEFEGLRYDAIPVNYDRDAWCEHSPSIRCAAHLHRSLLLHSPHHTCHRSSFRPPPPPFTQRIASRHTTHCSRGPSLIERTMPS